MLWNEISYEDQTIILDKICELAKQELNYTIRKGLVAAINELDAWSNNPCPEHFERDLDYDIPCFFDTEDDGAVEATCPY